MEWYWFNVYGDRTFRSLRSYFRPLPPEGLPRSDLRGVTASRRSACLQFLSGCLSGGFFQSTESGDGLRLRLGADDSVLHQGLPEG